VSASPNLPTIIQLTLEGVLLGYNQKSYHGKALRQLYKKIKKKKILLQHLHNIETIYIAIFVLFSLINWPVIGQMVVRSIPSVLVINKIKI